MGWKQFSPMKTIKTLVVIFCSMVILDACSHPKHSTGNPPGSLPGHPVPGGTTKKPPKPKVTSVPRKHPTDSTGNPNHIVDSTGTPNSPNLHP